jgi:hypothetical protein
MNCSWPGRTGFCNILCIGANYLQAVVVGCLLCHMAAEDIGVREELDISELILSTNLYALISH